MVAAASLSGSEIVIDVVGLNPTRTGIIDVAAADGRRTSTSRRRTRTTGEPIGTITVRHGELGPAEIAPGRGAGRHRRAAGAGARWRRTAASCASPARRSCASRKATASRRWPTGSARMGADIDELPDGFHVRGDRRLRGGEVDARNDHRLAMAFAIAALGASGPTTIHDAGRRGRVVSRVLLPCSSRCGREGGQAVSGRLHGRRQDARWRGRSAARLGWRVEDIDERIEARERRSVAAIFAQQGEAYFRQLERQVLGELLPSATSIVATGGGTFAEPDNRALMLADGAVAWLDVPLARVIERVPADGRRPLAADRAQMEQLYARRQLAYAEAHVRIDAHAAGARGRRAAARRGSDTDAIPRSSATSTPTSRRSRRRWRRPASTIAALVLGDLVGYGADPNAVIERVRALPTATIIRGNHDKVGAGLETRRELQPPGAPRDQLDGDAR